MVMLKEWGGRLTSQSAVLLADTGQHVGELLEISPSCPHLSPLRLWQNAERGGFSFFLVSPTSPTSMSLGLGS